MTISINNKTLAQIQDEFSLLFPYLRVEFFKKENKQGTTFNKLLDKTHHLMTVYINDPHVSISANMTVIELEQLLREKSALHVQILRKSGKSWLETSLTSDWTLHKQNQEGYELSKFLS